MVVASHVLVPRHLSHIVAMSAAQPAATPAVADPVPDVVATMFEMDFEMPAVIEPGRQVWAISNTGVALHELAIQPVPAGATKEQIIAAFGALYQGRPLPVDFGPEWAGWQENLVNGVGATSPGGIVWAQFDLKPGTYAALCFVPSNGVPHLMAGMIRIFTVTG